MTTAEPTLERKLVMLADSLQAAHVPFAFGGAIALAYYAEPRATIDIDINVFVEPSAVDSVVNVVREFGVPVTAADRLTVERDGQVRLWWGITPLDFFFAYERFHFNAAKRIRRVPFGEQVIPILAPEDLLVCKAVFDRRKDWIDIGQMLLLTAGELDVNDARRWLVAIAGAGDERVRRLDDAIANVLGNYSA